MQIKRIFDLLDNYRENYPNKPDALAAKIDGKYVPISSKEYIQNSIHAALGFIELGIQKDDKVATISNNRPEWNYLDMGLSMIGAVHVPVYPTISDDDYTYILNECEAKLVVLSDINLYKRIKPIAENTTFKPKVYTINKYDDVPCFSEIIESGKQNKEKHKEELEKRKNEVDTEDTATIIYTSGTTGDPKGVVLTHKNLISNFTETVKAHHLGSESRVLSFLPLNHIYERGMNYHYQLRGMGIYYAENMGTIANNLKEVKPHLFTTVPRLIETVYDKIIGKGKDLKGIKKVLFFWAVNCGLKFKRNKENGWWYHFKLRIADKLIFSKWREALGGNVQIIVTGGAAIQERLLKVFGAAKIDLVEGYGLTETSPVIAVNHPATNRIKFGTVGPVLNGMQVKIADDGEILCKGPCVMKGYYKRPDLTKDVIDDDGWFHTGDIGMMIDNEYLKITDRKKEIFKLSSGKYIAPQIIENKFKESFFIEQVMVIGENQKFASALLVPNFSYLHNWCYLHKIKYRDNSELIQNPEVIARFQKEVNACNKHLGQTEQIKRFRLVVEEWSPKTGELSPTLKLKRKVLHKQYEVLINEIYFVQNANKQPHY